MELKEWKEGIAFLQKMTNQRRAEPEPFLLQVGKDGRISLVVGDERGTFVWRTQMTSDVGRMKVGVPSKPLVQTTKVLKGKDTEVSLTLTKKSLLVQTTTGGELSVPFVEQNLSMRAITGDASSSFQIDNVAGLGAKIAAASDPKTGWGTAQIEGSFLTTTDSRKFFSRFLPQFRAERLTAHRVAFWDALSGAKTDGEAVIYESGIRIVAGNFEASTGFVEPVKFPNMVEATYPEGSALDNYAVMDRKVLIGSLKAVGPSVQISMLNERMINLKDQGDRQVGLTAKQARGGSGSIKFSAELMADLLSSMDGKEVIVAWKNDARQPLRIADSAKQSDVFLLAPIWKAA